MTHSTAIECSTVTEIENQLLFDDGIAAKGRSLTGQMMNIDLKRLSSGVPSIVSKEDKGEYIQSLVDSQPHSLIGKPNLNLRLAPLFEKV